MAIELYFNSQKEKIDNNVDIIINKSVSAQNIGDKIHRIDKNNVIISKVGYTKVV